MSTIGDGQGGAHKEEMWVWPLETLLVCIPSFISITVVGGGGKPRTDLETIRCASD
jgi:hypothetical protein